MMSYSSSTTAEPTSDFIGNKIVNIIIKVSKNLSQNNSESYKWTW